MRILLIEDDRRLVKMLHAGLKEEGFFVEVCEDGESGLQALRSHAYDACILDLNLPAQDGFSVLQAAQAANIATAILILTARDAVEDRVRGLNLGADDYLIKPFAFAELLARLHARLRKGQRERVQTLRLGNLELDTAKHVVHVGESFFELTQKQFALLEQLLRHADQVVTRTMLLSSVWGYSFDPGTNLVDVHIGQLRRKLEQMGSPIRIVTVRGLGYRAEAGDGA